jgi:hypothetical protein
MDYWTYRTNFTGADPSGECWTMNITAQNVTEAFFLSVKNAHIEANYTSGGVNPLPPKPNFPLPKPPPPPPNNTLAQAVEAGKYPYLYDAANKSWTTSATVRNVFTMGGGGPCGQICNGSATPLLNGSIVTNSFMNGGLGHSGSIGPELGIGHMLEQNSPTTKIMLLKSCIGNRALGWDLLPPTDVVRLARSHQLLPGLDIRRLPPVAQPLGEGDDPGSDRVGSRSPVRRGPPSGGPGPRRLWHLLPRGLLRRLRDRGLLLVAGACVRVLMCMSQPASSTRLYAD